MMTDIGNSTTASAPRWAWVSPATSTQPSSEFVAAFLHPSNSQQESSAHRDFPSVTVPLTFSVLSDSDIADPEYRLCEPFLLSVETDVDGAMLAYESHPRFNVYGVGDTHEEAIADLASMLLDYYRELLESEANLSRHLQRQLALFRRVFVRR